jgi:hypothetical protein
VWKGQGIDDYKMMVAFGSYSYIGRFYFTVRDNQITQIDTGSPFYTSLNPTAVQESDLSGYAKHFASYGSFPPSLNEYTMDNLFDFAARQLASEPTMPLVSWCGASNFNDALRTRTEATFNSDLGYIQSFHHTNCPRLDIGGGLLCPAIGDCQAGFSIRDFEPIK